MNLVSFLPGLDSTYLSYLSSPCSNLSSRSSYAVTVLYDSFSVLFRRCSISASSYDRHRCSKLETQLDLPWSTSPFLFVTRILSIGTNQSQSIQASIVSRSLPRHSSQLVTHFPLSEVTDPTCQSPLSSCTR